LGIDLDKWRFRANIFMDLASTRGFAEDGLVGRILRIGPKTVVSILERDPRCAMITIDPFTAERNPVILGHVTKAHDGKVGVYAAVLVEGMVRVGDDLEVAKVGARSLIHVLLGSAPRADAARSATEEWRTAGSPR
jgi:uncharacterized protein YcbX